MGGLTSGTSISIVGAGSSSTIIEQQASTIDRIFEQDYSLVGNIPVMLSGLTVQNGKCTNQNTSDCGYGGGGMLGTGDTGDNLTLNNVTFNKNTVNATANGGGLASSIFGGLTITSCAFSSNTATGGVGGALDFNVGAGGSGNLGITTSSFTGNASTAGSEPGEGGAVLVVLSSGNSATISKSTFTGNQAQGSGSIGGAILANLGTTVSNSRIVGNTADTGSGFAETGGTGNTGVVIDNWWGCNAGPGGTGCDTTGTSGAGSAATFNPWLVLSISANPTQVAPDGTSTLTGDLSHNSNAIGGFSVPDGTGIMFGGGTLGTAAPSNTTFTSGTSTSTFTAGASTGSDTTVSATVDNQTVDTTIDVVQSQVATSIAVTSVSPASEAYGQDTQVTITAVLSWTGAGPAPTASDVTIGGNGPSGYGATSCGAPSSDTMTCMASYTPSGADTVGSYTESASFSGDSNYTSSSSTQTNNFSITQATSSTSVGSSQNPSLVGQSVTFTATIGGEYGLVVRSEALPGGAVTSAKRGLTQKAQPHPLIPTSGITGNVMWSTNTGCGTTTVSGGTSQCITTTLPQGTDTITATYSGDTNHIGSVGTLPGGQVVNPNSAGTLSYPPTLDFGAVYLNSKHKLEGTIKNTGTANVTFTGDSITLGTADAAAYKPFLYCTGTPLKPGKTCTVAVDLLADAVGTLTATLNIMDNASGNPQQIGLTANVIDPVAQFTDPVTHAILKTLSFGGVAVNGSKTLPVELTNVGQTALNITNVSIMGSNSTGLSANSGCGPSLAPTDSCTIQVTFAPTAKGARAGSLVVTDNVAAGKSSIPISATGK